MKLFRVVIHHADALNPSQSGHPLYIPRQASGRIDDPEREYKVWYCAPDPLTAIVEAFRNQRTWSPVMLEPPPAALPGSAYALARVSGDLDLCDMDDPSQLLHLGLRPSRVVTGDRATTQQWARQVHDEAAYDGISWWCGWNADRLAIGVWDLSPIEPAVVLDLTAALILEAAELAQVFAEGFS